MSADRYTSEFFAAPSPDGQRRRVHARAATASGQWWRNGHSPPRRVRALAASTPTGAPQYEQLTERGAKQLWPMWSADGKSLYFMSDRSGAQNIWTRRRLGGSGPRQVTQFTDGRVLWPTISQRRPDDRRSSATSSVWTLDTASGQARRGADRAARRAGGAGARARDVDRPASRIWRCRPDGKQGRVRRRAARSLPRRRATAATPCASRARRCARVADRPGSPDSRRIVYVLGARRRRPPVPVRLHDQRGDAADAARTVGDAAPSVSPDGKSLAFVRDGKELRVIDLATKAGAVARRAAHLTRSNRGLAWSPDSRWIAYVG